MFKTVLKVIFLPHILIFKLGKKMWSAITGFFDGFSLEDMMSKLGDISIVKYIMDLKDKIVNGLKSFILNIVPETFFKIYSATFISLFFPIDKRSDCMEQPRRSGLYCHTG